MSIVGLDDWLASPQGRYVLAWEQDKVDAVISDIFGFNALQLGLPQRDYLRANRISLRQRVDDGLSGDVRVDFNALPFAGNSIDLVVLPHLLEFHSDPHQLLREIERILLPGGQVVIIGFNPLSLWGAQRHWSDSPVFPWNGHYLSVLRLKDWLKLLGFEVDRGAFGCYCPPVREEKWLQRLRFMELAGDRWWGFAGGVYLLRAVKQVAGMRLVHPAWKRPRATVKALAPLVPRQGIDH
jgi:SAM-dependent methyltransferase